MSTSRRTYLGLACFVLALVLGASGCDLYLGPDHNQDHWSYCDQSGCYDCVGNSCQPQAGPGYACTSDTSCSSGCYCDLVKSDKSGGEAVHKPDALKKK